MPRGTFSHTRACRVCLPRCPSASACPAPQRDCDRPRPPPPGATGAASRATDQALQPPAPPGFGHSRRARRQARTTNALPTHPSGNRGGRRTRTRDPDPRPEARTTAPERARRWPDRRRTNHRQLVTPRPPPLRSRLRTTGRRGPDPGLKRPNDPTSTQPAAAIVSSTAHSIP